MGAVLSLMFRYLGLRFAQGEMREKLKSSGKEIYDKYNCTAVSDEPFMLPPVPSNPYIDELPDKDLANKSKRKEKDQQDKKDAELEVYRALESIKNGKVIVLSSFKYTHEHYQLFVGDHDCTKSPSDEEGECDFIVLHENMVVIIEVKAPESTDKAFYRNFSDSIKQRNRTRTLVEKIASYGLEKPIEILEFSVFSRLERVHAESFPSYQNKIQEEKKGTIMFKDGIKNISKWFNCSTPTNVQTPSDLQAILIGLWSLDTSNKDQCGLGCWIKTINEALQTSVITRKPGAPVSSNVKGGPEIFKKYLNITCITEEQKQIFKSKSNRLFIIGPAGSGKTILILAKAIQLVVESTTKQKIVIFVSGQTSGEYYKKILEKVSAANVRSVKLRTRDLDRSVDVDVPVDVDYLPVETLVQQIGEQQEKFVIICREIDVQHFPGHPYYQYHQADIAYIYDLLKRLVDYTQYHIFMDDMQDILNRDMSCLQGMMPFIKNALNNPLSDSGISSRVIWVANDTAQDFNHLYLNLSAAVEGIATVPKNLQMSLSSNLRNTIEISKLLAVIRDQFIAKFHPWIKGEGRASGIFDIDRLDGLDGLSGMPGLQGEAGDQFINGVLPHQATGHRIHGPKPRLYIILEPDYIFELEDNKKLAREIVSLELSKLCSTNQEEYVNIALVTMGTTGSMPGQSQDDYDYYFRTMPEMSMSNSIKDAAKKIVDNIEICDVNNCSSTEWPAVVAVLKAMDDTYFLSTLYKAIARARVYSSTIITVKTNNDIISQKLLDFFRQLEAFANIRYYDKRTRSYYSPYFSH